MHKKSRKKVGNMDFTMDSLIKAGRTFLFLFGELFLLFIVISFVVALLQIYVSKEKIQRILTTPRKTINSILGAVLGAVTPFCSCSTVPILLGLIKSGAPFSGMMSFLLTSPILNPAIIALFFTFFGVKATLLYTGFTFVFAVVAGLVLDKMGFEKEIKNVSIKGGRTDIVTWESLHGTLGQRHKHAVKFAFKYALDLFRDVLLFLLMGASIGAFIYEFVPTDLLGRFAGANNLWAVPVAALVGIPMYIRTETMIPIASILIGKGVGSGTMIALIIGGAGASIPEVSLLSSIFKKRMIIAFLVCIMLVAIITGYMFNILL